MAIIGVCGRKGGSGKTTIAVHLASELVARGLSAVLVDCDLQGSSKSWAELNALPMPVEHMPIESDSEVLNWSKSIRSIKAQFIVLDSPPHLNAALGAIIGLADVVIVPCGPSGMDLIATGEMVGLVREIRAAKGTGSPSAVLVPNRVDHRTGSGKELKSTLENIGELVSSEIGYRMAFSDAFNVGQWVGTYAPGSMAHVEIQALASFVLKQMKGAIKHEQQKSRI